MKIFFHFLFTLLLGILNALSFAPTPAGGWLNIFVFAAFYYLLLQCHSYKKVFATAWIFGLAYFAVGVWWLYISMHVYGGMPALLAIAALLLFSAYLALFPALSSLSWFICTNRYKTKKSIAICMSAIIFGAAWSMGEWLRGTLFTGFPWLSIGYAQIDTPLAHYASFIGVYGVSFITAFCSALLAYSIIFIARARIFSQFVKAIYFFLILLIIIGTGYFLTKIRFTYPIEKTLSVQLLQGNIEQNLKFEQSGIDHATALYEKLITKKAADLIITPETALPLLASQVPDSFVQNITEFTRQTKSSLLLGVVGEKTVNNEPQYTNSIFGMNNEGKVNFRYDKYHLVPFGEFIPFGFHWFVNLMQIPLGDFARGAPVQPPFRIDNQNVAVDICYEDIFGEEIARTIRGQKEPASILVNVTNLAWFGNTNALDQHLQMARMRAIETGRPMLRATNTGFTAFIDANGHVQKKLPPFTVGSLSGDVQGMKGFTPYILFGNKLILIFSFVIVMVSFIFRNK